MKDKKLVVVEWNDAHGNTQTAFSEYEIPHAPIVIQSVGWLLREDVAGITIAAEYCDDATWRGVTFVPKGMIVQIRSVAGGTRPRRKRGTSGDIPPPETT